MAVDNLEPGTVAERTNAPALKAGGPQGPGVRIPPVPLLVDSGYAETDDEAGSLERPAGGDSGGVSTSTVTVGAARCTLPSTVRSERPLPRGRNVRRTFIRHDGLPEPLKDFAFSDLNELQTQGMIRLTTKLGSSTRFEITNDDWKYWEAHQETRVERIEAEVRRLLDPAPSGGRTRQRSLAGRRPGIPSESKSGQPALDEDEPLHSCDSQGTGFVSHLVTGGSTASDRKSCGVDARGLRLP